MVTYSMPDRQSCWSCGAQSGDIKASHNDDIIYWTCVGCGEKNVVVADPIHFRVGERLLLVAECLLRDGEADLAAIMLCTAVESMLAMGIYGLKQYRACQNEQAPPDAEVIRKQLKNTSHKDKLKLYETLSRTTFKTELAKAQSNQNYGTLFSNYTVQALVDNFKILAAERNRFVHEGEAVSEPVVRGAIPFVQRTVFLLDRMWDFAFMVA